VGRAAVGSPDEVRAVIEISITARCRSDTATESPVEPPAQADQRYFCSTVTFRIRPEKALSPCG
jgi:hypothetical protein